MDNIKSYIITNAHGMFLWVDLVVKNLRKYSLKGYSEIQIFEYLKSLPLELSELYALEIINLERNGNDRDIFIGRWMFQLALFALRPLTLNEFHHAIAMAYYMQTSHTPHTALNRGFVPLYDSFKQHHFTDIHERIIDCTGNLLEIKSNSRTWIVIQ